MITLNPKYSVLNQLSLYLYDLESNTNPLNEELINEALKELTSIKNVPEELLSALKDRASCLIDPPDLVKKIHSTLTRLLLLNNKSSLDPFLVSQIIHPADRKKIHHLCAPFVSGLTCEAEKSSITYEFYLHIIEYKLFSEEKIRRIVEFSLPFIAEAGFCDRMKIFDIAQGVCIDEAEKITNCLTPLLNKLPTGYAKILLVKKILDLGEDLRNCMIDFLLLFYENVLEIDFPISFIEKIKKNIDLYSFEDLLEVNSLLPKDLIDEEEKQEFFFDLLYFDFDSQYNIPLKEILEIHSPCLNLISDHTVKCFATLLLCKIRQENGPEAFTMTETLIENAYNDSLRMKIIIFILDSTKTQNHLEMIADLNFLIKTLSNEELFKTVIKEIIRSYTREKQRADLIKHLRLNIDYLNQESIRKIIKSFFKKKLFKNNI